MPILAAKGLLEIEVFNPPGNGKKNELKIFHPDRQYNINEQAAAELSYYHLGQQQLVASQRMGCCPGVLAELYLVKVKELNTSLQNVTKIGEWSKINLPEPVEGEGLNVLGRNSGAPEVEDC